MIIPETLLKIKRPIRRLIEGSLIILILGLFFILGRISVLAEGQINQPIEVIYPPLVSTNIPIYNPSAPGPTPENWAFVASKTGETYYPKDCKSFDRIKPENRVYFTTVKEAQDAGLTISSLCK